MNRFSYDDIEIGMEARFSATITEEMMASFCEITKDINPLHNSREYAVSKGYTTNVCYGMLTGSFLSTLAGVYLPGERSLIHRVELDFIKPVLLGDELNITGKVTKKMDAFKAIVLAVAIVNQNQVEVLRAKMRVGILD